ncbi:MAG: DUF362 domain-containing protein [Thermodesulfobacteriota bacterium]|nr:DUF362 domain-containing protein [Thermodesulfobacteriota bacterium]
MTVISLERISTYENGPLKEIIQRSIQNIGIELNIFYGKWVAIKPNLLMPAKPDKAIITDPEFFRAVVQIVRENGGKPILIESPAIQSLNTTIRKTEYAGIIESENVIMGTSKETMTITYDEAVSFKHIDISSSLRDVDIILNLPKFKTHGLTYITGAVKNLFGVIPGLAKSKMHIKIPSAEDFSDFLLDLYGAMQFGFETKKTIVHIMDAILVQEGEGPGTAGTPKKMNAVVAGLDAVAIDYVIARVAGLNPDKAMTITRGFNKTFGVNSPEDINVVGLSIQDMQLSDFKESRGTIMSNMVRWPFTSKHFKNLFIEKPVADKNRCTLCYKCKTICPAGAISSSLEKDGIPKYDYNTCIRCYCCMEICPEAAIHKKRGPLQWMIRI